MSFDWFDTSMQFQTLFFFPKSNFLKSGSKQSGMAFEQAELHLT